MSDNTIPFPKRQPRTPSADWAHRAATPTDHYDKARAASTSRADVTRLIAEAHDPDKRRARLLNEVKCTLLAWSDGTYTDNEAMHRIAMFVGMHPDL